MDSSDDINSPLPGQIFGAGSEIHERDTLSSSENGRIGLQIEMVTRVNEGNRISGNCTEAQEYGKLSNDDYDSNASRSEGPPIENVTDDASYTVSVVVQLPLSSLQAFPAFGNLHLEGTVVKGLSEEAAPALGQLYEKRIVKIDDTMVDSAKAILNLLQQYGRCGDKNVVVSFQCIARENDVVGTDNIAEVMQEKRKSKAATNWERARTSILVTDDAAQPRASVVNARHSVRFSASEDVVAVEAHFRSDSDLLCSRLLRFLHSYCGFGALCVFTLIVIVVILVGASSTPERRLSWHGE